MDVEFGRDAGRHEPLGEVDGLVTEQVHGPDVEECRGQAGQVGGTSRCGVLVGRFAAQVPAQYSMLWSRSMTPMSLISWLDMLVLWSPANGAATAEPPTMVSSSIG
jgi:hypothetical protein